MRVSEVRLGDGALCNIESPPQCVSGVPLLNDRKRLPVFKILFQLSGSARVAQGGRTTELRESMFTFLDSAQPVSLEMPVAHRQLLLQLPRHAVVARFRGIERRTAIAQGTQEPGAALLHDFAVSLAERASTLSPLAGAHAQTALMELLGVVSAPRSPSPGRLRVEHACAIIELELADESLSPNRLAARLGVSRRHLDALFSRSGSSVSAHIWERRLTRAAALLTDPTRSAASVSEICFEVGFQDPAHFARAFKKRFGVAPSAHRHHRRVTG